MWPFFFFLFLFDLLWRFSSASSCSSLSPRVASTWWSSKTRARVFASVPCWRLQVTWTHGTMTHSLIFFYTYYDYSRALSGMITSPPLCFYSVGNAAGRCWEAGGEALRSPACDEFDNVPQTGFQRGGPPVQPLTHVRWGPQLAWPRCCPVRL